MVSIWGAKAWIIESLPPFYFDDTAIRARDDSEVFVHSISVADSESVGGTLNIASGAITDSTGAIDFFSNTTSGSAIFWGKVGINDATPDSALEVVSDGGHYFMISSYDDGDGNILIVDSAGNVGIGTTTPSNLVHIYSAAGGHLIHENTGGATNSLSLKRTTGGDNLIVSGVQFVVGSTDNAVAGIYAKQDGGTDATAGGELEFHTRTTGGGSLTNRLTIDDDGHFDFKAGNLTTTGEISITGTGGLTLPQINEIGSPTLSFGDGNTGFTEIVDNQLSIVTGGSERMRFKNDGTVEFRGNNLKMNGDNVYMLFGAVSDASIRYVGTGDLGLYYNSQEVGLGHHIFEGGRIGLGDTSPDSMLEMTSDGDDYFMISSDADLDGNILLVDSSGSITFNDAYTFPTVDGNANEVLETDGSGTLSFVRMPKAIYAELSDSTDQEFAAPDTPFSIKFDTNDEISGITHSITTDSENISIVTTGVYTMFAQPQVATGAGGAGKFHMWLQKNTGGGFADIPNTNIELSLASQEENVIPLATTFLLDAGDVIRLRASVSDVRIKLHAQTPAGEPAIPSIIFTMFMIGI